MASIFQNSTGSRWRVELWGGGEEEGGDAVKNGANTHLQQGGHKGALFLQESYAGNKRRKPCYFCFCFLFGFFFLVKTSSNTLLHIGDKTIEIMLEETLKN